MIQKTCTIEQYALGTRVKARGNSKITTEVFIELYDQYMPKVFQYFCYRVGAIDLAEDLTSAVFEKVLKKSNSYSADKASIPTWLFCIAQNVLIDHFRTREKRWFVDLGEAHYVASVEASPEKKAIKEEELRELHKQVSKLSEQEQEIISLKFGAEMNNRQIAGVLELSESNVGTILYRAIRKLRGKMIG